MHTKKKKVFDKDFRAGILFALPAIIGFFALNLIPMLVSLFLSFTKYSGMSAPTWIGLRNYILMFTNYDSFFYKSLQATITYTILNVPAVIIFAFLMALLLNSNIKGRSIFRAIFYLPSIVPAVASAMIWLWMFNPDMGVMNQVLRFFGLPTSNWIFSQKSVIPSIVLMGLWGTGSTMVIFLAGLQDVPKQLYEAIDIDGGNSFTKLIHITIPMLTPTIFFNTVMCFINSFQVFTQAFILTQGGPNNASLFYSYYLYREAFRNANMGYASALAWFLFIIIAFFSYGLIKSQSKWVYYEGGNR